MFLLVSPKLTPTLPPHSDYLSETPTPGVFVELLTTFLEADQFLKAFSALVDCVNALLLMTCPSYLFPSIEQDYTYCMIPQRSGCSKSLTHGCIMSQAF